VDRSERLPREAWVKIALLAIAFIALFYRWILAQNEHSWGSKEDWGHAYVVPLISLYILWQSRGKVREITPTTFWPGLAPMLLGVMCYFFFVAGAVSNHMLQGFSLILTLAGMCLLLLGPRLFRYLFLPISYLLFAITVSEQIMIKLTFELQHVAAVGAWLVLRMVSVFGNFLVDINGNQLTVGNGPAMNVAEACSGMRMVIAFIALGGAVALFQCKYWWQRVALLLLATPVAVFTNIVRVAVLGLISMRWPTLTVGDAHVMIGTALLVLGLGIFMGIVWALNKIVVEPAPGNAKTAGRAS
jgi:exosortase